MPGPETYDGFTMKKKKRWKKNTPQKETQPIGATIYTTN